MTASYAKLGVRVTGFEPAWGAPGSYPRQCPAGSKPAAYTSSAKPAQLIAECGSGEGTTRVWFDGLCPRSPALNGRAVGLNPSDHCCQSSLELVRGRHILQCANCGAQAPPRMPNPTIRSFPGLVDFFRIEPGTNQQFVYRSTTPTQ